MTIDQAATIVATMQTAWGTFAADKATNEMWLRVIARQDMAVGLRACRHLVNTNKFPPTFADWNEAVAAAKRALDAVRPSLPPPARSPHAASNATQLKQAFAEAQAERAKRQREMSVEDFIRSEGGDPATHRVTRSGHVVRIPPVRRHDGQRIADTR